MTEEMTATVNAQRAGADVTPLSIPKGNQIIVLSPEEEDTQGYQYATPASVYEGGIVVTLKNDEQVKVSDKYTDGLGVEALKYLPSIGSSKAKPKVEGMEGTVVWDLETTGTTPFDSRIVMATMWLLTDDKADMVTFADEDEEVLVAEIADYFNAIAPKTLVSFNAAFDTVFLSSRLIKYQIAAKGFYAAKHYDLQDWAKRGIGTYLSSTMKSGTLEEWAIYLFGEQKPFDIETCFEAYEAGDLSPFYVRNRWDVATEGDFYRLIKYSESVSEFEEAPEVLKDIAGTRRQALGTADVICNICKQRNVYDHAKEQNTCFICGAILPEPTETEE